MNSIGKDASEFFNLYINANIPNRKYDYRTISGVLSLRKKYSDENINSAYARAILFNSISYKTIKNILEKNIDTTNLPSSSYISNEENSFKRDLNKYNIFFQRKDGNRNE